MRKMPKAVQINLLVGDNDFSATQSFCQELERWGVADQIFPIEKVKVGGRRAGRESGCDAMRCVALPSVSRSFLFATALATPPGPDRLPSQLRARLAAGVGGRGDDRHLSVAADPAVVSRPAEDGGHVVDGPGKDME